MWEGPTQGCGCQEVRVFGGGAVVIMELATTIPLNQNQTSLSFVQKHTPVPNNYHYQKILLLSNQFCCRLVFQNTFLFTTILDCYNSL